jgi:hypothetical protein
MRGEGDDLARGFFVMFSFDRRDVDRPVGFARSAATECAVMYSSLVIRAAPSSKSALAPADLIDLR